jgi:hypothetical protein
MGLAGPVVDRPSPLLPPVLSPVAVAAGFEIGMLVRCARSGRCGRVAGPESSAPESGAVEFSGPKAAARLVTLLDRLGCAAQRDDYTAGGRHRYTVHRVTCADLGGPELVQGWCAGYRRLCAPASYLSAPQRQHRADLAGAAWRAALLVGGIRGRGGPLAVRVAEPDLAVALVRAARVLDVAVTLRSVGVRHLVEVAPGPAELVLRNLAVTHPAGG